MGKFDKTENSRYNRVKGQRFADNTDKSARIKAKALELADLIGLPKGFYGKVLLNFQNRTPVDYHAEIIERL
jgi:hypothetical protein